MGSGLTVPLPAAKENRYQLHHVSLNLFKYWDRGWGGGKDLERKLFFLPSFCVFFSVVTINLPSSSSSREFLHAPAQGVDGPGSALAAESSSESGPSAPRGFLGNGGVTWQVSGNNQGSWGC